MVAPKIREKKVMRAQARSGRKRYIRDMGTLHHASKKKKYRRHAKSETRTCKAGILA